MTLDAHERALTGREPWMTGHADGVVSYLLHDAGRDGGDLIADEGWEAKTDRAWTPWEHVPPHYQCQAQWYMFLSGWNRWHFTVGFSGWKVRHYVLERNEADIKLIVDAATSFYNDHILTGTPPAVDDHQATAAAVAKVYANPDPDKTIEADDTLAALIAEYGDARAHATAEKKRQEALAVAIKAAIGNAEVITDADGNKLASWSPRERTGIDEAAVRAKHGDQYDTVTRFRQLTVTKQKPPTPKDQTT